jgi:hypothetical protein
MAGRTPSVTQPAGDASGSGVPTSWGLDKPKEPNAPRRPVVTMPPPTPIPELTSAQKFAMEKIGKRMYRQADGSLGETRPPRNPYTVATRKVCECVCVCKAVVECGGELSLRLNRSPDRRLKSANTMNCARKAWASLVAEAARQTDEELTTTGKSYRLGIGVSWTDHAKYLEKLGLEVGVT